MSDDDDKGNVVDFIKRAEEMRDENNPGYIPQDEDIEVFLNVLDFIRTLSISNTGRFEFDEETLKIILTNYVDEEAFGEEGLVTKRIGLHRETEMDFPGITNTESGIDEEHMIAATEDFNDMLYVLAESFRDADEEDTE